MIRRALPALLASLLLSSCLLSVGPSVSDRVDLAPGEDDVVRMVYLGTGGWIMEHRGEMVLSGPLVTNPGIFRTGLLEVRSDTAAVNRFLAPYDARYDLGRASAILVGHAHYDHLLDVPHVARRFAPDAAVVTNRTGRNIMGSWSGVGERVRVVNDSAGDQRTPGPWLPFGERVRVMALRSHHAPHFDGFTLYHGTLETPRTEEPAWASDWLDGRTFAFLIDFMSPSDPDSVAFRIYYQDAVAAAPAGFAPRSLIDERPVDVAILVPSTFDQVDWHPEAFVENLRPRWILMGHWEDFFSSLDEETRSLPLSDLGHFQGRLERVFDGEWWRPEIGTEFRFPLRRP